MPEPRSDHAALLQEVSWIRRLARELVADRDLAEDLVQETCAVALERGPREAGKLRAWLGEVLRNLLRQHARSAGRRHRREGLVARPEALESTGRLVERVHLQRELVGAVLALEEPYRSTVLLRFFEELPPREIARRTETPLATVNSRLARALARLRARLDGERPTWAAILVPWVRGAEALGPATALPVLMNTKLVLSGATLLLAAGALVLLRDGAELRTGAEAPAPAPLALEEPLGAHAGAADGAGAREESATIPALPALAGSEPALDATAPAASAWTVRLRVLDAEGLPMPGVPVSAEGTREVLGTSGRGGWCVFPSTAERLVLVAADPRWVTIHAGSPTRASSVDPLLVLAPALGLGGFVRDELGRPLAGASVRFDLPEGFRTRFTEVLEATRSYGWRTTSAADGRFAFAEVPAVAGARLSAVLDGYARARVEAPLVPAQDLELVLLRPRLPQAGTLRGRVLEPSGAPVAGARVGLGLASVTSDERGSFELALARAVSTDVLTAVKAGHRPARLERPGEPSEATTGWPDEVTLVLPGPALAIRGTVVDHDGAPVAGARLWVHDPTPGAPIGLMPTTLEAQMAGGPVPPSALESEASLPKSDGDGFYDHYTTSEAPSALWSWVESDAEGRFELSGLDERRYRLEVLRPQALEIVTTQAFQAGEGDARIRLDPPDLHARVEGRVVAEDGAPLADVHVTLLRPLLDVHARVFGGRSQVVVLRNGGSTTTDAEGRFHFEHVPRRGARLDLRGDGIVPCAVEVTEPSLVIPVEQRCHLEVVLRTALGKYDAIEVADGEGQRLDILELSEGATSAWSSVELVEGRSGVVSVSARARELRLLKSGVLVETRALDLVPGDVNRIEL